MSKPMTKMALNALKASIRHWEEVVADPLNTEVGPSKCALCRKFNVDGRFCHGCPVDSFGCHGCMGSPYDAYEIALADGASEGMLRRLAQDELDFLRSLLPQEPCS